MKFFFIQFLKFYQNNYSLILKRKNVLSGDPAFYGYFTFSFFFKNSTNPIKSTNHVLKLRDKKFLKMTHLAVTIPQLQYSIKAENY